jgi:hypothetical protein
MSREQARGAVAPFAATEYFTVPEPVPAVPSSMVTHGAVAVVVHVHDGAEAVTVRAAVPPSLVNSNPAAEMV